MNRNKQQQLSAGVRDFHLAVAEHKLTMLEVIRCQNAINNHSE